MKRKQQAEDPLEPGKFYVLNNNYDEALKFFLDYLTKEPGNPEVYYHLGLIYEAKNEFDKAKDMYEKVLSILPDHTLAKKRLEKLVGI